MHISSWLELRRIGALAEAYDITVNPHTGGTNGACHWSLSHVNGQWAELFMPSPGGPKQVYDMFDKQYSGTPRAFSFLRMIE